MKIRNIIHFFLLTLYLIIVSNNSYSNNHNNNLEKVYEHLRNKQFTEAINKLKELSEKNKPEAQLLYAKILYSGEITTQDFEMAVHSFRKRNRKFGYKEYDFKKIV